MTDDFPQDLQRRQLLKLLGTGLLSAFPAATIPLEAFLPQCESALKSCWHLLKGKDIPLAEELLATYIPTLTLLITSPSPYQETLAALAAQAKILQAILAMHRLNLVARETCCHEAVTYSRLSNAKNIQAASSMYLGYTYTYSIPHPQKAIPHFLAALAALKNKPSHLLRSDIYMGLADAYAQCSEEQEALRAINLAYEHFPHHPEQDPDFLYADCGWFELHSDTGKMYLDLARHYPAKGYYQQAYDTFTKLTNLRATSERNTCETLIRQADAARGIGDLDLYIARLSEGTRLALTLGSQKRYSEACAVFQQTPAHWKHEKALQNLAKEIFHHPPQPIST